MTHEAKPGAKHPNRKAHNWLVYDIIDRFLVQRSDLIRGKVYDLGAGSSAYKDYLLSLASEYVAVDWPGSFYDARPDIVANLNEDLSIEDGVADVVVSLSVLEHLHTPQSMLVEAHRILRQGGVIILQVPWQWSIHEAPHDYYRYTPEGLCRLLENAGFHEIDVQPQAGFFTTMILKANYFGARFVRGAGAVRRMLRYAFSVIWYAGQKAAPVLDRLDGDWSLETIGFFVTARKP